jgi:hypothetical protein
MSSRIVTGAFLVGVLAVSPALAQERHARPRGEQGGANRGGDNGGERGANNGSSRGGERRVDSARAYQPQRAPEGRSYNSSRQVASPQYTAPRQYNNNAARQYTAPRAYSNGSSTGRNYNNSNGSYSGRSYNNGNGGYNNGHYSNGHYNGQTYNRSYAYSKPGYAPPRAPYYRNYARPYYAKPYYAKPYYAAPYHYHGYRGVYGYGGGYRHTRIVTVVPWRPYYYRPHFSIGVYYGAGGVYDYGYTPSYYYNPVPGQVYGGVRITEAPPDAQVFADGNFVGIVDDFDGVFQHVNLEAGQHRIEVRAREIPPISFDVYVQPGRTITLRADDYNDGYAGNGDGDGY